MEHELIAQARLERTRGDKQRMRRNGMVPAIVYGKNVGSVAIAVDAAGIKKILNEAGTNALINMKVKENGNTRKFKALIKAIQRDPVRRDLIHIDFHQVSVKDRVHATVPVHLEGTPAGVLGGGILAHLARRVEVECQADRIPDSLVVDISGLEIGDTFSVAELELPDGVKILDDPAAPVVMVTAAERPEAEAEAPDEGESSTEEEGKELS